MTFEGSATESVAGTLTLNTGAALSFTNIPPETAVITAGGLSVGAASVPVNVNLAGRFSSLDTYKLIGGANISDADFAKFAIVSVVANGEDIADKVYLELVDGDLCMRRYPGLSLSVR